MQENIANMNSVKCSQEMVKRDKRLCKKNIAKRISVKCPENTRAEYDEDKVGEMMSSRGHKLYEILPKKWRRETQ